MLAGTYSGYGIALGYISSGKPVLAMGETVRDGNKLMGLMPSSPTPSSREAICSPCHHKCAEQRRLRVCVVLVSRYVCRACILSVQVLTSTDSDAPRYIGGFIHNIAMSAMSVVFMCVLRMYLGRLNKKLDAAELAEAERNGQPVSSRKGFRYIL